jgi:hypothetical protein
MPAQAGIHHGGSGFRREAWIPAYAGMTDLDCAPALALQLNIRLFASYKSESMKA